MKSNLIDVIKQFVLYISLDDTFRLFINKCVNFFDMFVEDKDIVIFGSGSEYGGNSKIIFEWICKNHPDIDAIWIEKEQGSLDLENKHQVVYRNSFKTIWLLLRAKIVVAERGLWNVALDECFVPNSVTYIATKSYRTRPNKLSHRHQGKYVEICGSEFHRKIRTDEVLAKKYLSKENYKQALELSPHNFVVTGYPKTDNLLKPSKKTQLNWEQFHGGQDSELVILYTLSQYHKGWHGEVFPFQNFDIKRCTEWLCDENITLYIREHPVVLDRTMNIKNKNEYESNLPKKIKELTETSDRVRLASHYHIDLYNILPFADCLITDHSKVFLEYLILDNPIIFIDPICSGTSHKGVESLLLKIDKPGPQIKDFEDIITYIEDFTSGNDNYSTARSNIIEKFYQYKDQSSTERIGKFIIEELKTK